MRFKTFHFDSLSYLTRQGPELDIISLKYILNLSKEVLPTVVSPTMITLTCKSHPDASPVKLRLFDGLMHYQLL